MKYEGVFRSIIRDKKYTVQIITNNSSTSKVPITLGPNAFSTSMDTGSTTIYSPVKYSGASIQIVGDQYLFDLYSSTAKQNKVELLDASNNILWTGYTTPNTYSAPYDFETSTYTIEAIDGLSVLQYYKYEPIGATKDIVSFKDILKKILNTAGCYRYMYFTKTITIPERTDSSSNIDNLYISEQDFFDEEDEAMTMKDVLEEICKFMNVTCVADGKDVYFINYDAIKDSSTDTNCNQYKRYTLSSNATADSSFNLVQSVTSSSYAATGANLSLDDTYSKVSVRDSLYTVDSIIPSMFEDEDLKNVNYQSDSSQNWLYEYSMFVRDNGEKKSSDDDTYFNIRARFYENKKYVHNYYTNNGSASSGYIVNGFDANHVNHLESTQKRGASFARFNIGTGKTAAEAYAALEVNNFSDYLMMPINYGGVINSPVLESSTGFEKPFFMSSNAKLIAKGSLILTDRDYFKTYAGVDTSMGYFPDTGTVKGDYHTGWYYFWHSATSDNIELKITKSNLTLRLGLDTGSGEVINEIPFYEEGQDSSILTENVSKHEVFYQPFDVRDNVTYNDNIEEKGYILNTGLGNNEVFAIRPKIKIYGFSSLIAQYFNIIAGKSPFACSFVKDFDIVGAMPAQNGNVSVEDINETDTLYEGVINNAYVNELSEISFKICTWDNKQLNYSAVAYKDNSNNYHFLNNLKDIGLNSTEKAEELLIRRIINQYSNPCKKLTLNLFNDYKPWSLVHENFLNVDMIVNSMSIDYVADKATINLVEKV